MTKKALRGIARVLIIIALLSIFLPFVKVESIYVFGSSFFESLSIEEMVGLEDPLTAGANIFYILAVVFALVTLAVSFVKSKHIAAVSLISSLVSATCFSLVGLTFNSMYSAYDSLTADGIKWSYDVGWYITTFAMVGAAVFYAVVFIFGSKMEEQKMISEVQRRNNKGWWFISPFIVGFLFFYLQPIVISLWYTFNTFKLDTGAGGGFILTFCGVENYEYMLGKETDYWQTLVSTLEDMLITVPIVIIFSVFIAVILNQKFHGRMLARAIFFMPVVVTSGIIMGIISGDVTTANLSEGVETTDTTSIFQAAGLMEILQGMNLPKEVIEIFSSMVSSIFDTLWKCGVQILLFLSALQSISPQLYEAAKIEGATGWEMFWKVTFPNLTPIILVNIIYTIIDSLTDQSNALMKSIENMAFTKFSYHTACLEAWIFFVILLVIVGLVFGIFALFNREKKPKYN